MSANSPSLPRQRGAYAIALERGRLLVLPGPGGRFYLPGGRLEAGETMVAALIREVAEECARRCRPLRPLGRAEQPIFGGKVLLEAHYWEVELDGAAGSEAEHAVAWLEADAALAALHRPGDREALRSALRASEA